MPARLEISPEQNPKEARPRVRYYAGKKVKAYEGHPSMESVLRGLHPRTVIELDEKSHLVVKKFDGFERGEEFLIDRLELTKNRHTTTVCEFKRVYDPKERYLYQVWNQEGLVGNMWGEDLDTFDLTIASLFYHDPAMEQKTAGSGMDNQVEELFRHAAQIGKIHRA